MFVESGIKGLDEAIQGLRLGDNVVWQVEDLPDYVFFAEPFIAKALRDGRRCVYIRFAPHPPVLEHRQGLEVVEIDPGQGFDYFSREVHKAIEERGRGVFYVFDNISSLVVEWATDELLANFFQVTCPYLLELDTIAYFALTRGKHSNSAVARIRDTTQVLIDVFSVEGRMFIHPLKVWDRYAPEMFLPHEVKGEEWPTLNQSGDAAAISSAAADFALGGKGASIAPWDRVYDKLVAYRGKAEKPGGEDAEVAALKSEFRRMLIGDHPEFNRLADRYLGVEDLFAIRDRLIGTGRIGGKAAGMLLARRILTSAGEEDGFDFSRLLEEHDSFYIGSDVFFTFLVDNDLFRLRLKLTSNSHLSYDEFAEVEQRFLSGRFPPAIMEQFRNMLDYFGQAPIIVRSSSLLEDSFGNAFAGKYRSEFCANQGNPEERMESFLRAVKLVYASAINPDALSYRRKRGLGESDEQMAILVQRVSGMPYKRFFFPCLAGVAFSRNLYAWSSRIDPEQGIIRLVFGLGTRAVERVGKDYPRMIPVSNPELRPESASEVARYSQRQVDLLDLEANEFTSIPLPELLSARDYPGLYLLVSVLSDGYTVDPVGGMVDGSPRDFLLTFNNLIRRTEFCRIMGAMLSRLEAAYGHPVDIEFTAAIRQDESVKVNLLQCRPLFLPGSAGPVFVPEIKSEARVLFRSSRMINGGVVRNIRFIVYIDPLAYSAVAGLEDKREIGRLVGRINEHPLVAEGRVMMMGPGRWGSSNINLGVNVSYGDIHNAVALVEIAREEAGHVPEVSYGTHFFQDLVEDQTIYLPVYPDSPEAEFNQAFFDEAPNALTDILPGAERFRDIVHLIDVPQATDGMHAQIVADPRVQKAVCFLE
ncbi:MAG: PEP/pyruvate-binding domain-containing protein [Actinomycetota bacterium]|nr:PEP/pyruvate-binding domain-containing protein [Actinomycetota bacterium]